MKCPHCGSRLVMSKDLAVRVCPNWQNGIKAAKAYGKKTENVV